ncbi:MAG: tRNA pseudouridine(55) synthase TruB [Acidobacteriota bacterium]
MSPRRPKSSGLDGLLLVDKGSGYTSHDVVGRARRALGQRKIGHCGTLDPEATGLLLLTLGRATRLTRFLIRAPKVYEGTVKLGIATDTYDAAGDTVTESSTEGVTLESIREAMSQFQGKLLQTPPAFSAKKVGGRKSYELARKGEAVELEPAEVEIFEFVATSELEDDSFDFRLSCSSGTYARSLAHEVGQELGCGAHLCALRRTQIGPFAVSDAVRADDLDQDDRDDLLEHVTPFDEIQLPFDDIRLDASQERRIRHGQTVVVPHLDSEEGDWVRLLSGRRQVLAVGSVIERIGSRGMGVVQPRIVFVGQA